ncbi:hypothetical protein D5F11_025205 [Siminovitchia terrae]|uniref:Uncharacterized protein n=1 Tax=Siminovitchia terrae TaxID=1914933 RepID=A0A429X0L1_SIMTE|nr:hypothetical protein D5F11_025205 [Siminovitchia terrae]
MAFIGGNSDKSYGKWESTQDLYHLCQKALHKEKEKRYTTIQAFYEAWHSYIEKHSECSFHKYSVNCVES